MAISPDGRTLYVASLGTNTVIPISTKTNKPGKPIKVGPEPGFLALTPDGRVLYVLSYNDGHHGGLVTAIRTATKKAAGPSGSAGIPSVWCSRRTAGPAILRPSNRS